MSIDDIMSEEGFRNAREKKWVIPVDRLINRDRIVVYGAGEMGTFFYNELIRTYPDKVIIRVDKNYKSIGGNVKNPETIMSCNCDAIVIAIANSAIVDHVESGLLQKGIDKSVIIRPRYTIKKSKLDIELEEAYDRSKTTLWSDTHSELNFDQPYAVTSMICNQSFFDMPFVQFWSDRLSRNFIDLMVESGQLSDIGRQERIIYHRKLWEFVYICQALYERGMLCDGKRGVAFGVGEECLPDLFASMGTEILATDLDTITANEQGWTKTGENIAGDKEKLNKYRFCDPKQFSNRVSFRVVDMNCIPKDITGYDFCWSACACEHLGSIKKAKDFIMNSLNTLRSGGVAVHTTEYNLYSDNETFESDALSLFRKRDILELVTEIEEQGNYVYPIDFHVGEGIVDGFIDLPPYSSKDMHLRLRLNDFACTSIGLIIKKI